MPPKTIVSYWNKLATKKTRAELEMDVRHCRARLTHNKERANITFAVAACSSDLEMALHTATVACGREQKAGPPPGGRLEREAVRLLELFGKAK